MILYNYTTPDKEIILTIPQGSSGITIAEILFESELTINKNLFLFLSDITGSTKKFQSGIYKFNQKMNSLQIINMLKKGKTYSIKITIPEGYICEQIAEFLEKKHIVNKNRFLEIVNKNNLEGYLFPETYFLPAGSIEQEIIDIMANEFKKRYNIEFEKQAEGLKMTKHEIVTLASIIEKEANTDEERKLISGIFYNRLKKGWLLESCATVRYALKKYKDKLTYKNLQIKSPYNTYRYYGLPPGPICNPGLSSLNAALYPANTDLMFFFSNGKGTHEFSKYYEQHIEKQKELK